MNGEEMKLITRLVKGRLASAIRIEGPDIMHLDHATQVMADPSLAILFDVVGSHNAAQDNGATTSAWARLQATVNKPTWATEDPRDWSVPSPASGEEIGTKAIADPASHLSGLVIYLAFPHAVDSEGKLTPKGRAIAEGIGTR